MKILIYGFGRMGITHFAILNGLTVNTEFSIIEPNKVLRAILNKNLRANLFANDYNLNDAFDLTLIATPPSTHVELMQNSIKRCDKKIFIEKPFGGFLNTKLKNIEKLNSVYIGYVLRFNPCIQWIKSNINTSEIKSVYGQYLSNTIEKKPNGWRNGQYSGVSNEMGSHIIDLIQYIIKDEMVDLISSEVKSVISDTDDIVRAVLKTKTQIDVSLFFNWVDKDVRKPIFSIEIEMRDGSKYNVDQQQINKYIGNKLIEKVSVADLVKTVPYYLRGVDFTNQMIDLLEDNKIIATASEAICVNNIISKIINK